MEHIFATFYNLFWFLVVISVVVFIHEYGHFIIARWNKVRIDNFSIGFGKEIFGWNDKYGTRWSIRYLPFGGFVKMYGDSDPASSPDFKALKKLSKKEKEQSFYFKKLWQKAAIVFAGPFFNYLSAYIIMLGFILYGGKPFTLPEITDIVADSPAQKAGLKVGDLIIEANGGAIESFEDLRQIIALNLDEKITLIVERNGKDIVFDVYPKIEETKDIFGNVVKIPRIGIASTKTSIVKLDVQQSIAEAFYQIYDISVSMLKAVWQIITAQRSTEELGGPIKIAQYSGQSASLGFAGFLWFIAIISINLGLINLFPIPMLDGGHLMYYALEAIRGKAVSEKAQELAMKIGFALLMLLMVYVTFNDIRSLVLSFLK